MKLINRDGDFRTMVRVTKAVEDGTMVGVRDACNMLIKDIRSNWSSVSPSPVGSAPASKAAGADTTGNLDSSILLDEQKRDTSGRFSRDAIVMFVRADTTEGIDPQGRGNYTQAVQEKNDRPFMQPAIDRMADEYMRILQRSIRI